MRIVSAGHVALASILIVVGVTGLINGDFGAIWQPVPKEMPGRELLAWLCGMVSLGGGAGLLWQRTAAPASRVLLACLLLWLLLFKGRVLVRGIADAAAWESCGETVVLVAGAWVLYAWFATDWGRQYLGIASSHTGLRIARILYALALIAFGVAHFAYVKQTASLVPAWLPSPAGWVYLTGSTYIAAGVAILIGIQAQRAAALSTLQMGLFTLLVWLPIVAAPGHHEAFQWSETVISAALTAAGWVVADSYRGWPWFAAGGIS